MKDNRFFPNIPESDTTMKTPIVVLEDVLNDLNVFTQLKFDPVQNVGFLLSRPFQYRVTDGRYVAFGLGLYII